MRIRHMLMVAALTAVLGGLSLPVLAEMSGGSQTMPGRDMGMGHTGQGMSGGPMSGGPMSGGPMSGGPMSGGMTGGCMGMMQSMNNGNGRPNSQWQKHPPGDRSMPN